MILRRKLLPIGVGDWPNPAAMALVVLIATTGTLQADVRIEGDVQAVRLDATTSTVAEALSALESAFRVRIKASMVLDRPIGGTYTGALPGILSRLLQGYNYVINRRGPEIEVTIFGLQVDRAVVAQPPQSPALGPLPGNAFSLADAARLKIH